MTVLQNSLEKNCPSPPLKTVENRLKEELVRA